MSSTPQAGSWRKAAVLVVALGYAVAVLYLGTAPRAFVAIPIRVQDKIGHAIAFGLMQWTHTLALEALFPLKPFKTLRWLGVFSAVVVDGLLEVWQAFLPARMAEFFDLVADAVGAFLFSFAYRRPYFAGVAAPGVVSERVEREESETGRGSPETDS